MDFMNHVYDTHIHWIYILMFFLFPGARSFSKLNGGFFFILSFFRKRYHTHHIYIYMMTNDVLKYPQKKMKRLNDCCRYVQFEICRYIEWKWNFRLSHDIIVNLICDIYRVGYIIYISIWLFAKKKKMKRKLI